MPRRRRPVPPHAAANELAMAQLDIAETVAANLSRRTGHPRADLRRIAVIGLLQATCRCSPERGPFRPHVSGEVYHCLRDKGFLIKVPATWRELHARGQRLQRCGTPPAEIRQLIDANPPNALCLEMFVRALSSSVESWLDGLGRVDSEGV
jgi:hypothetical protein